MDNTTNGETGATFDSSIHDATIPDSPGVGAQPQAQSDTPLSSDVDPIHDYENPEDFAKAAPLMPGREESASSDTDAGLDSDSDVDDETSGAQDLGDEEALSLESADLDEDLDAPLVDEIPMGNLDVEGNDDPEARSTVMSPSLDAPDTPGELDIEALGDNAIEELLPPDARLDPIEE